jgi:anti-sigma B factor antagonist
MSDAAAPPGGALKLSSRQDGDARILAAGGQLTELECAEFMEALNREFDSGARLVVLDMGGLTYMSSAGLGAMVSIHKKFSDAGRKLVLAGANTKVRKLLALTSLDRLIEITDDVGQALSL